MKWEDVTDDDLETALAIVKNDYEAFAAKSLIEYFHERFKEGYPYNERVLIELVTHAFAKIVEANWTADQAFGLKLRRGHYQREPTHERDMIAAAYMTLLIRRGMKWLDAKGSAANLLFPDGTGEKAVEKAYANYKVDLAGWADSELIAMLPDGAPLIKRDMRG